MVEIFQRVNGQPIEKVIARTREAQDGTKKHARATQVEAQTILDDHRHDGDARIVLRRAGKLDWMVELNDERGQGAAMTIEFGREGGGTDKNGRAISAMEPVAPLRRSIGRAATKRGSQ